MKRGSSDIAPLSSMSRFCYTNTNKSKNDSMDSRYDGSCGDWFARGSGGDDLRRTQSFPITERKILRKNQEQYENWRTRRREDKTRKVVRSKEDDGLA